MFQSIAVLLSSINKLTPAHNYLDDLESFFYVLCIVIFGFEGPGLTYERSLPDSFKQWSSSNHLSASDSKYGFITRAMDPDNLNFPEWWGEECLTLLLDFKRFFKNISEEKDSWVERRLSQDQRRENMERLLSKADEHYAHILFLFYSTIEKLKKASQDPQPSIPDEPQLAAATSAIAFDSRSGSDDSLPASPTGHRGRSKDSTSSLPIGRKRRSDDALFDDQPQLKRAPYTSRNPSIPLNTNGNEPLQLSSLSHSQSLDAVEEED
ncbi:hypothetical protein MD484_g7363, partial [Candolleomyces efflorescens]